MTNLEQAASDILARGKTTIAKLCRELSGISGENINHRRGHQIIRNLRELSCPIVGDSSGIWIATSDEELVEFANRLENKAKRDIASMLHLKKKMMSLTKLKHTSVFEQLNLFDHDKEPIPA